MLLHVCDFWLYCLVYSIVGDGQKENELPTYSIVSYTDFFIHFCQETEFIVIYESGFVDHSVFQFLKLFFGLKLLFHSLSCQDLVSDHYKMSKMDLRKTKEEVQGLKADEHLKIISLGTERNLVTQDLRFFL